MGERAIAAGGVATVREFDLDHLGPIIRQELGAVWTGNVMGQVRYAEIRESRLGHDAYESIRDGGEAVIISSGQRGPVARPPFALEYRLPRVMSIILPISGRMSTIGDEQIRSSSRQMAHVRGERRWILALRRSNR
jgi:hypothetical protein